LNSPFTLFSFSLLQFATIFPFRATEVSDPLPDALSPEATFYLLLICIYGAEPPSCLMTTKRLPFPPLLRFGPFSPWQGELPLVRQFHSRSIIPPHGFFLVLKSRVLSQALCPSPPCRTTGSIRKIFPPHTPHGYASCVFFFSPRCSTRFLLATLPVPVPGPPPCSLLTSAMGSMFPGFSSRASSSSRMISAFGTPFFTTYLFFVPSARDPAVLYLSSCLNGRLQPPPWLLTFGVPPQALIFHFPLRREGVFFKFWVGFFLFLRCFCSFLT